jgi:Fe2+ or Zn2+ uptake regulation protein
VNNLLTKKQRSLLLAVAEKNVENNTLSRLIRKLSSEFNMPLSTVRWNLKILKKAGLIIAGDKNNKGIRVRLTALGIIVYESLKTEKIEQKMLSKNDKNTLIINLITLK